ncbi:uncharacterized protein LOC114308471 [Camellia sinensis]|uniref:uncharacterized protein LOC114308471 n=1 Tax=Camellia sinensis TaxID=4442 RepID=UPI001036DBEF|nr:uncharacterized protein LOC114308471 [Camellia sinensis]
MVNSFWPSTNFDFASVDASSLAGGILCAWDLDVFSLDEVVQNKHFILLKGKIVLDFECILINVYASNDPGDRKILWDEISNLRSRFTLPSCIGGDINEVCKISERKNCLRINQGMRQFNDFISNLELCNLPLLGRNFTWSNNQDANRWSRIDRFICHPEWVEKFNIKQWGLQRLLLDHCPVLIMDDNRDWGPKPFRSLNAWASHPGFTKIVKEAWNNCSILGWAGFRVFMKLKEVKSTLKSWNSKTFGNLNESLYKIEEQLYSLDLIQENQALSEEENSLRRKLKLDLWKFLRLIEQTWLQKSRQT